MKAPARAELESLVHTIIERVGCYLERQGLLVHDLENGHLALEPQGESGLEHLPGSSITCRIAIGPHQDQKAFSL